VAASGGRWQGVSAEMPFEFPIRLTVDDIGAIIFAVKRNSQGPKVYESR